MEMYFNTNITINNILFSGWNADKLWIFVLCCLLFAAASIFQELLSTLGTYLTRRYATNPLDMKWTSSINARSPLLAPLQIPSSVAKVKQRRCQIHFGRSVVHLFSVALGYTVMLVVMRYNAYLFVAIVGGSAVGYFLFALWRRPRKRRVDPVNRRAQRDDLTRSGQLDTSQGSNQGTSRVNYYGSL